MKKLWLLLLVFVASCTQAEYKRDQQVIDEAIKKVFPSLVFIKPIQEEYSEGKKQLQQVFGSGFIISNEGYVVTNSHVAEKSKEIKCVLFDKEEISAEIVGLDKETDLAVLRLNLKELKIKQPLTVASFGDSRIIKEGDAVMAMGSPYGFTRSISRGIISSTERYFEFSPYNLWFQTDAAINPGNSGGPLVNERGEVVGVNSLGLFGADNIGFAIPSEVVKEVAEKLIRDKKVNRAWVGIKMQALKDFSKSTLLQATKGVLIASVDEGSPAEIGGLKAGDILLSCNDKEINGIYQTDLPLIERFLANLPIGSQAKFQVLRTQERTASFNPFINMIAGILGTFSSKPPKKKTVTKEKVLIVTPVLKEKHEGDDFECKKWNMTVKEITKFSDLYIYFQKNKGVFIQGVKSGGNAEVSGLYINDILVKIGDVEISSLKTFKEVYEKLIVTEKGKRKIKVVVMRYGYLQYLVLDFERDIEKIEEQ